MVHGMTDPSAVPPADLPTTPSLPPAPESPCFRSLWKVVLVQAQNALNDKIAQYVLLGLALVPGVLNRDQARTYPHLGALLLALPLILFAPLAGWLSDRYSKRKVLFWCSVAQLAGMTAITTAFYFNFFWCATFCFFVLASQATIFSPAKGGIIKELVGDRYLTMANSWTQATSLVALVCGPWFGGALFKWFAPDHLDEPWMAAFWPMLILTIITVIPVVLSMRVRATPEHSAEKLRWSMLWEHFLHLGDLLRSRNLRLTSMGVSFFWCAATVLALLLVQAAKVIISHDAGDPYEVSALSGFMLVWVGLGIAAGSVVVGFVSTNRIELGLVPLGGLGMALGCSAAALPIVNLGSWVFDALMFLIGVASGVFLVPLSAYLQDLVEPSKRGRQLSAAALLDSLGMFFGILVQLAWAHFLPGANGVRLQLLLLGLLCLGTAIYVVRIIPQNFLRFVLLAVIKLIYRVRVVHPERVPQEGGALLIANHVSYVDAFIISAACERKVRFIASDQFYKMKWIGPFLKLFDVVPVSPHRAKDAIVSVAETVAGGDLVCIFPEGQITRTGMMNELRKGYELIARRGHVPVVPVYMDDLWGSLFSFERGRFFKKWPKRFAHQVSVGFGEPTSAEEAHTEWARRVFRDLSAEMVLERRELRPRLEVAVAKALTRNAWRAAVVADAAISRAALLARGVLLARQWRDRIVSDRVAIQVEGWPGLLANLALRLAGFTPINVNLPESQLPEALAKYGIGALVSAGPAATVISGLQHINLTEHLQSLDNFELGGEVCCTYLFPVWLQMWRVGRHRNHEGTSGEAVGWLAADAQGQPQLRTLSHEEVLLQSEQLSNADFCRDGERLWQDLAPASGPGTLLGIWHPLLHGTTIISTADAAEQADLAAVEARSSPAVWPEFPGPVRGVLVLMPPDAACFATVSRWQDQVAAPILPCLFAPDSGRILSVSMAHPETPTRTSEQQIGHLPGAAGRLLPGYRTETIHQGLNILAPDGAEAFLPGTTMDHESFITLGQRPDETS